MSGDYTEDTLPLRVAGCRQIQTHFRNWANLSYPNPINTAPESKITKNVYDRILVMSWLVAKESRAVNKPSRSFTVPGEGPTWAFSLYRAPTFPATESSRTRGGSLTALLVDGVSAGDPCHVPPRPIQLALNLYCVPSPASQYFQSARLLTTCAAPLMTRPGVMAAAVLLLHPAQPLHLHCDQHPGLGEPPADLPHQHAPLGQTQLPVLTVI